MSSIITIAHASIGTIAYHSEIIDNVNNTENTHMLISFHNHVLKTSCVASDVVVTVHDVCSAIAACMSYFHHSVPLNAISTPIEEQAIIACLFVTQHMKQNDLCVLNHLAYVGLSNIASVFVIVVLLPQLFVAAHF